MYIARISCDVSQNGSLRTSRGGHGCVRGSLSNPARNSNRVAHPPSGIYRVCSRTSVWGSRVRRQPVRADGAVYCATLSQNGSLRSLLVMHLTSERGRQCELRDGTPTVARTTTRPSTVGQRFSRRVRRYLVSLGRRTLRRPAHPSGAPATNPEHTGAAGCSRSPPPRVTVTTRRH